MADEQKMISVSKIDEIMEDRFQNIEIVDYYGEELAIHKVVSFAVFAEIVRRVSDVCFYPDTGEFLPERMEFAIRLCVINAYTNVRLPEDTEHQYSIIYRTDLWDTVSRYISMAQYNAMVNAIQDTVCVKNDANKAEFDRAVNEVLTQISEVGSQLNEIFGSVSSDDIQNLVNAISAGRIDEEKIVKAVVAEQNKLRGDMTGGEVIAFPTAEIKQDDTDGE